MPSLVGKDLSYAENFAEKNNINLVINYIEGSKGQSIGQIVSQSIPELTDLEFLASNRSLSINIISSIKSETPPIEDPNNNTEKPII
jgi:hypothetical protein